MKTETFNRICLACVTGACVFMAVDTLRTNAARRKSLKKADQMTKEALEDVKKRMADTVEKLMLEVEGSENAHEG